MIRGERKSSYVDELRSFSVTYRLTWGSPEDLEQLCHRLTADDSLREDFEAAVRSIYYQEHCLTTETDLLGLIGLAWGGIESSWADETRTFACDLRPLVKDAVALPQAEFGRSAEASLPSKRMQKNETAGTKFPEANFSTGNDPGRDHGDEVLPLRATNAAGVSLAGSTPSLQWWAEGAGHEGSAGSPRQMERVVRSNYDALQSPEDEEQDLWKDGSAFHQELLRFAERRERILRPSQNGD